MFHGLRRTDIRAAAKRYMCRSCRAYASPPELKCACLDVRRLPSIFLSPMNFPNRLGREKNCIPTMAVEGDTDDVHHSKQLVPSVIKPCQRHDYHCCRSVVLVAVLRTDHQRNSMGLRVGGGISPTRGAVQHLFLVPLSPGH